MVTHGQKVGRGRPLLMRFQHMMAHFHVHSGVYFIGDTLALAQWVLVYFPSSRGSLGGLPILIHTHSDRPGPSESDLL